jgi:hypothetical protein
MASAIILFASSCVQKTHLQTVIFKLNAKGIKNVATVGLRGEKPLQWNQDTAMTSGSDSMYTAKVVFKTGYKFVQYKYTLNGEFELKDQENRKIYFDPSKTTMVQNDFNKRQ